MKILNSYIRDGFDESPKFIICFNQEVKDLKTINRRAKGTALIVNQEEMFEWLQYIHENNLNISVYEISKRFESKENESSI